MSARRLKQAEELTLRIENFVDLAGLIGSGSLEGRNIPEPMEDFIDHAARKAKLGDDDFSTLCRLCRDNDPEEEEGSGEELAFELMRNGFTGVLLEVATPVKSFYKPDSGNCSYSWGHYHTGWVYGTTFDKAWSEAIKWAKAQAAYDKAASLKKKGGAA